MTKPLVAVVGRPNVGKSTFFNRIVGMRVAIVEDTPGVTRDRIYADATWLNYAFTLIDTGGIDPMSDDPILMQMKRQAEIAIDTADVILFFVDAKEGMTGTDMDVANMLRKADKPVLLVANKVDRYPNQGEYYEFYNLGIGDPIPISSQQALGLGDLLDEIVQYFPPPQEEEEEDKTIKIAVVGKPNVGKSSFVNKILNDDRVIVSNVPGTTRDAIDTPFSADGRDYIIIDTAGMRKRGRIEHESIERFGVVRALNAIRRCDVAVLMIDAQEGVTDQDAKIAGFIQQEGRPCLIVVNKWDLIEKDGKTMNEYTKLVMEELKFIDYAPILFISALTGQRVTRVIEQAAQVHQNSSQRIGTGLLNDVVSDAVTVNEPPFFSGRSLKIYYCTQASTNPPTIVFFVNDVKLMHFGYERYLENFLRKSFNFAGTPIKFVLKNRTNKGDS